MGLGCNPTLYNSSEHPNVPMWGCLGIWISKILGFRNWKTGNWRSHIPPLFHWTAASRAIVCSVSTFLSRNPQKHCYCGKPNNKPTNQPTNHFCGWYIYHPQMVYDGLWHWVSHITNPFPHSPSCKLAASTRDSRDLHTWTHWTVEVKAAKL